MDFRQAFAPLYYWPLVQRWHVTFEEIKITQDSSWRPGATVSLHGADIKQGMRDLLFLQEDCPKEFRWKPSQPEPMSSFGSDIVIKCVQGGRERTDVVARWSFLEELAKLAKYDKNGEAVIEFKRKFSFGEAFCRFRVKKSLPTPSPGNPNSTPGTVINNYIHNGDKFLGNMNGCIIAGRNNVNSISMGSM